MNHTRKGVMEMSLGVEQGFENVLCGVGGNKASGGWKTFR